MSVERTSQEVKPVKSECTPNYNPDKRIENGVNKNSERNAFNPDSRLEQAYNETDKWKENFPEERDGIITYIETRNSSLKDSNHPITGVEFKEEKVKLPNGEVIVGVFAQFKKEFCAIIQEKDYLKSDKEQFKQCNEQLYKEILNNPELKQKFTKEQIEQIKDGISNGSAPDGYVWHHEAQTGKISLPYTFKPRVLQ